MSYCPECAEKDKDLADMTKAGGSEMMLPHDTAKAATRMRKAIHGDEYRALALKLDNASKYRAVKTEVNDIMFDSRGEAAWYAGLLLRQKAGEIRNLQRQVAFELQPGFRGEDGHFERAIKIIVDATYDEVGPSVTGWRPIIADFKGWPTPDWKLKWKMLKYKLRGMGYKFVIATKGGNR
jgi:hypothetical protein